MALIIKSFLGLIFLDVCLALALFLPAGSMAHWQVWAFLSVWTICVILITLYLIKYDKKLLESRVQAGPTAETQLSQKIIQALASLFFVALFIMAGLDFRFQWSSVAAVVSWISDGFIVAGFFIVFLVFKENSFTSAVIEVANDQKVISTGPYRIVRHPMYSGAFLLLLFVPLGLGSIIAVPFSLPLIAVIIIRLIEEEKFLVLNLAGYDEYQKKVRFRLIPFVW